MLGRPLFIVTYGLSCLLIANSWSRPVDNFDYSAKKFQDFFYELDLPHPDELENNQCQLEMLTTIKRGITELKEATQKDVVTSVDGSEKAISVGEKMQLLLSLDKFLEEGNHNSIDQGQLCLISLRALAAIFEENYKKQYFNLLSSISYPFKTHFKMPYSTNTNLEMVGDVPINHPTAYTEGEIENPQFPWKKYEENVEKNVSENKNAQDAINKFGNYELARAREVVFFSKTSQSHTSPKFKVKDLYDQKWQLKLSTEAQTEPVVSRLLSMVGLKGFDLVYGHNVNATRQVVFFPKPEKGEQEFWLQSLLDALKGKPYKFDATKLIHARGKIKNNKDASLVQYLRPELVSSQDFWKQIDGMEWVVFKESSIEFVGKDSYLTRMGMVSASELGAQNDRAFRAASLFHFWTQSRDTKGPNHRAYIIKNADGGFDYSEGFQDSGASLGDSSGDSKINKMKSVEEFVRISDNQKKVVYFSKSLYRPVAWDYATWEDQVWMAKRIIHLSHSDLAWAFEQSYWPKKIQQAFISILEERQLAMANVYRLEAFFPANFKLKDLSEFEWVIDWKNQDQRTALYLEFPQIQDFTEEYLKDHVDYRFDTVIDANRKLSHCRDSLLVGVLEEFVHPSGLERRPSRFFNSGKLKSCFPR